MQEKCGDLATIRKSVGGTSNCRSIPGFGRVENYEEVKLHSSTIPAM